MGHDGRTIRYPHPEIKVGDTVKMGISSGKITDFTKFGLDQLCTITLGRNKGRVGIIEHVEKHPGSFDIVQVRDRAGNSFATRKGNVFVIGKGNTPMISLPKGNGVKVSIIREQQKRLQSSTI